MAFFWHYVGYDFSHIFLDFSVFSRREIDLFSRFSTRNSKAEKCASLPAFSSTLIEQAGVTSCVIGLRRSFCIWNSTWQKRVKL